MEMANLEDLYIDQLKDLYNAENQLVKALPKMAKAASTPELQQAFEQHLHQTEQHVNRLAKIFEMHGESPRGKKCYAMQGLIEEGKEMLGEDATPKVMDAGLIAAAQRVEHYEIAGYGTVRAFAENLGHTEEARILQETLNEESAADKLLTRLAESVINSQAQAGE